MKMAWVWRRFVNQTFRSGLALPPTPLASPCFIMMVIMIPKEKSTRVEGTARAKVWRSVPGAR